MWKELVLSNNEFKSVSKLFEGFGKDYYKFAAEQEIKNPILVLSKVRKDGNSILFAPESYEVLSKLQPQLKEFNPVDSEQPEKVGAYGGCTKIYGDEEYYEHLSIVTGGIIRYGEHRN